MVAGCSVATTFEWVGKYGNTHTGWMAICGNFSAFCDRAQTSIGQVAAASMLFLVSMVCFVIKLNKSKNKVKDDPEIENTKIEVRGSVVTDEQN